MTHMSDPPALKLRDALDEFVPAWEKLEAKTSREFVVMAALTTATIREPRTALATRFIDWAIERFGNPDPVQGALKHALTAEFDRMPEAFRTLLREGTVLEIVSWTGEGDDQKMVQSMKKNVLQCATGVGGNQEHGPKHVVDGEDA